mmetsp:Transcript_21069/g.32642  ORF Transcript_21069/g.32642 Transcript_21069/m.32642 type:complete len:172 (-) Transcript_21069:223-738(-)
MDMEDGAAAPDEMMMMEPKMDEEAPLMENNNDSPGANDYIEQRKFCYCFSIKCGLITMGILLLLDFVMEIFAVINYSQNEYIDSTFIWVYVAILALFLVAFVMMCIFLCGKDSPGTRALLPWAFLIASIASFLIFIWIIVYFFCMYPGDKVYVTRAERGENDYYTDDEGDT